MKKIKELIERYKIQQYSHLTKDGYVYENTMVIHRPKEAEKDGVLDEIKERKQEILAYLTEEREQRKRAYEERERKIAAIEGLQEIKDAIEDLNKWEEEFEKSFEDVGGLGVRERPKYDLEAMYKKYPAAKAYIDAKKYQLKSNVELSMIGERAVDRIIDNPGEYEKIMKDMQQELQKFTERHLWD